MTGKAKEAKWIGWLWLCLGPVILIAAGLAVIYVVMPGGFGSSSGQVVGDSGKPLPDSVVVKEAPLGKSGSASHAPRKTRRIKAVTTEAVLKATEGDAPTKAAAGSSDAEVPPVAPPSDSGATPPPPVPEKAAGSRLQETKVAAPRDPTPVRVVADSADPPVDAATEKPVAKPAE